ncbi:Trafficking protein particle complex subunit-like protein [Sesamum angolense]|uniref:Trafficking protein particle complex subunit-like protein n=1 Tax=Sesamum angolense TaxID=2727404 RepID=A0AAE1WXB1_9LAMI|nr:Trafficking protein particle complex subunit-like protein [Sesamum angolense]
MKGKFEGEGRRIPSVLGDMIVCVAVVGHQNNPLYIQSFTEADDALKLHHIVHCSLDVVDERVNNPKKWPDTKRDISWYGYLTNTKVKFILVTTDLDVRDADVRNTRLASIKWHLPSFCFCENCYSFSGGSMLHMSMQFQIHFTFQILKMTTNCRSYHLIESMIMHMRTGCISVFFLSRSFDIQVHRFLRDYGTAYNVATNIHLKRVTSGLHM